MVKFYDTAQDQIEYSNSSTKIEVFSASVLRLERTS